MITARDGMKVSTTRKGGTVLWIRIMMGDISMMSNPRKHVIGLRREGLRETGRCIVSQGDIINQRAWRIIIGKKVKGRDGNALVIFIIFLLTWKYERTLQSSSLLVNDYTPIYVAYSSYKLESIPYSIYSSAAYMPIRTRGFPTVGVNRGGIRIGTPQGATCMISRGLPWPCRN